MCLSVCVFFFLSFLFLDVDECAAGICKGNKCTNVPGSYRCECEAGYRFHGDTCVGSCARRKSCALEKKRCRLIVTELSLLLPRRRRMHGRGALQREMRQYARLVLLHVSLRISTAGGGMRRQVETRNRAHCIVRCNSVV